MQALPGALKHKSSCIEDLPFKKMNWASTAA